MKKVHLTVWHGPKLLNGQPEVISINALSILSRLVSFFVSYLGSLIAKNGRSGVLGRPYDLGSWKGSGSAASFYMVILSNFFE